MKKTMKKVIMLITIIFTALTAYTVNAETGLTLTRKTYITYNGRTEAKFYTSKGYGYCITPEKTGASQGTVFSFSKTETDGGLLYLLEKGGSDDYTYLVTQLAVWKYRSNFMPRAFVGTYNGNQAVALANAAKQNSNYTGTKVTIKANSNTNKMSLSRDEKYYESGYISATTTGSNTYTVNVSGSSYVELVNANGSVVSNNSTFTSGAKFYVRIPEAKLTSTTTIKITVTNSGSEGIVRRYAPGYNTLQELVVLEKNPKTASTSVFVVATPVSRVCEYHNGKYYDKSGKETTEIKYKQQCETNICKKVGDKYFGKDGKETTEIKYKQQCETNICKKVGDKYFGKDGKETTEIKYKQQCETNICKKVGDKYFGQDGKETTQIQYQQQCETNICKKVGDKYFGKDGLEVSYDAYKTQCEAPEVFVPDTGTNPTKMIISLIIGTLIIAGTGIFVKRYNK